MPPNSASQVTYDFANKIDMSGTGNTQSGALEVGRWYTLFVDDNDIYVDSAATAATATTADTFVAAKTPLAFLCDNFNRHLAVIHSDGVSAHKATLVPSSPPV